jgi:hypothetical protein
MDTSALTQLLQQAADEQPAPAPAAIDRVTARAHSRRRRRISLVLAAVGSSAAIAGGIVAVELNTPPSQTVSIAPPSGQSETWRIDAAGLALLHDYAEPSGEISAVREVQIKETNWASYVVWARNVPGHLPIAAGYEGVGKRVTPIFTSSTRIYVIAQTGAFNCNTIYGCQGRSYNWVVNIIKAGDPPGGGLTFASPIGIAPPSTTALPGPSATLDTQTGAISATAGPAPGLPTLTVPSVIGQTFIAAEVELQDVGFSILGPDNTIQLNPPDRRHITSQDPAAGSLAPAGSSVTVTVSS